MSDVFTPEQRSRIMARVKGSNTRPEKVVRSLLHSMGYRFRLHRKDLPGKPDIVLPGRKTVIFVHGCFWHSHPDCRRATRPVGNKKFWDKKLNATKERDGVKIRELVEMGWKVLLVWECETRSPEKLKSLLIGMLEEKP